MKIKFSKLAKILLNLFKDIKHIPNTIYFNLKYLPFNIAYKLPIFVSKNVYLLNTNGSIEIKGDLYHRMINIGFGDVGIFDKQMSRSIWEVSGKIIFQGNANLGHGTKITVGPKGVLNIGQNFMITAESSIMCFKEITIGDNCLFSWEILMMDTDFHNIYNIENDIINENRPIVIGEKNWIGSRAMILKGTHTAKNCVVGANSLLSKKFLVENCLIAGNPAKVVKNDIRWEPPLNIF